MKVVIDAGHGGIDTGAILFNSNKTERITTESIEVAELAETIEHLAGQRGIPVRLTRRVDSPVEPKDHARTAGMGNCSLYAAIHMDSNPGRSWIFWSDKRNKRVKSKQFALILKQKLIDSGLPKQFIPEARFIRPDSQNVRAPEWKQLYISDADTDCSILWEVCPVADLNPSQREKLANAFLQAVETAKQKGLFK